MPDHEATKKVRERVRRIHREDVRTTEQEQAQTQKVARFISSGSSAEAFLGASVVALTILALVDIVPVLLTSIAAIAAGVGFLLHGASVSAGYSDVAAETESSEVKAAVGGGLSVEMIGGLAGITLGVLALFDIAIATLLPVVAITFGCTLLLSSGTTYRLNAISMMEDASAHIREAARHSVLGSASAQTLVGLGSATLGILALIGVGVEGFMLTIVALLAVGAVQLLSGSAITGRMGTVMRGH